MSPKSRWAVSVAAVGLTLDQVTKHFARTLGPREQVDVIPDWLAFIHARNPGAAFSMLADSEYRMYFFAVFTVVTVVALVLAWRSAEPDDRWTGLAIGLFLTGALGNAIDRLIFHEVTDFVKVYAGTGPLREYAIQHWGTNVYPIWNVADAAIVVAVPFYLLATVFKKDAPPPVEEPVEADVRDPLSADLP
jgi:signal peptidase II